MYPDSDFLFVYGTLGPSFSNPHAALLHQNSRYVGPGRLPGLLATLGSYPGARYDSNAVTFVHGFVYNISTRKTELLTILDEYEGASANFPEPQEYIRAIVPVNQEDIRVPCWTYIYNLGIQSQSIIDSGDYVYFLNQQ